MEMQKKTRILIILVLILVSCCFPVSASKIMFVNTAGVGNGTLTVTASNGSVLATLNPSDTFEISNTSAYHLDYQPEGIFALKKEVILSWNPDGSITLPQLNMIHFIIDYFSQTEHIRNLIILVLIVLMVVIAF